MLVKSNVEINDVYDVAKFMVSYDFAVSIVWTVWCLLVCLFAIRISIVFVFAFGFCFRFFLLLFFLSLTWFYLLNKSFSMDFFFNFTRRYQIFFFLLEFWINKICWLALSGWSDFDSLFNSIIYHINSIHHFLVLLNWHLLERRRKHNHLFIFAEYICFFFVCF